MRAGRRCRRLSAIGAMLFFGAVAVGAAAALAADGPGAAPSSDLTALLAGGSLAEVRNPVAANYLLEEGAPRLSEAERAAALDQLRDALRSQTNVMALAMQGVGGMLSSDAMRDGMAAAKKMMGPGALLGGLAGIAPAVPMPAPGQMEREMKQAMVEPWVRGIAAARALEKAGEVQAAARFYVNCLQILAEDWAPAACLEGIVGMGPERAEKLLVWMLDNAETVSLTGQAALMAAAEKQPRDAAPDRGAVQIRNAALEGLGTLAGSGLQAADARERAVVRLLRYASGKENEVYRRGAADGLGRARDPRGVEPLRRLARTRGDSATKQAALRGLAIGFSDAAALRQLRGELDDRDPEEQLRAAQALFEVGDAAAFRWAVEVIGKRRVLEARKPDIRARVVRDLVELGGEKSRQALAQALAEGPPNDWLTAWVRVGLLELGDASQLPAVEAALAKEDWALDPRGFLSVWRAVKPLIAAVAGTLISGGLGLATPSTLDQAKQAVRLIGNLVSGERSRYLGKANQREAAIAQLRWQTADALAASHPAGAARVLEGLLANPEPAVRLSAALALARLDQPEAIRGLGRAFALDYGSEGGVRRTPEVRASLLRAALLRFPSDPVTAEIKVLAGRDEDPGVRFIALVARR